HAAAAPLGGGAALLNPYGWRVYAVAWEHWAMRAELARTIKEWQPMSWENPLYWPFWPSLLLLAALCAAAWRKRKQSHIRAWPLAVFALYLGASSAAHERGSVFFTVAATAAVLLLLRDLGWDQSSRAGPIRLAAAALYAAFLLWLAPRVAWSGWFQPKHVPRAAVEFMARQRPALEPLRLYNQWEWGGYLAWKLRPWYRMFFDGRYLFHDLLAANGAAVKDPALWHGFMRQHGLDGALMLDLALMLPAQKRYPDGRVKDFPRPWYFFFMPRERWALVYWDEQALLFVDRGRVPPDWLRRHEYRYLLPHDEAARDEALRLKEIPAAAVADEAARHAAESFPNAAR
ncbi:MAG: hypothetical protein WC881_12255, partial [Elusimicrobiota bacterium]